ncbi:ATP-binding protein [Amycolatopsis sp. NPDC059027]|uniref:ATP-binding protein n=1 Tax=unclassified Amycolatopsis TaxID=2618356 RepID=UPI00366F8BC6
MEDTGIHPDAARDAAEFVCLLGKIKERSGYTYRQLEKRAADAGEFLPRSTLAGALQKNVLPSPQTVAAFIRACEGDERVGAWIAARNRIEANTPGLPAAEANPDPRRVLAADPVSARTPPADPGPARRAVPRQLPAAPRPFVGRLGELAHLDSALEEYPDGTGTVIRAIGGPGGIGKTWLALWWAHQHLDRFPDGQLYVNLRGFDAVDEPMEPDLAVRGFLDALGVHHDALPAEFEAQVGLYRSLVADKRLLVVLDNARDRAQITPLLPGGRACTVLITSRHRLTSLVTTHGARLLDLGVLPEQEAKRLLGRHLGVDRLAAEPGAVTELLTYCAGLPLALGIVATRAGTHSDFPLATLVRELRDTSARLDALDTGDLTANVRAVLSCSYRALRHEAADTFRFLGLVPGPDIGVLAASSLTARPADRTRVILRELENASLLQQHLPGRYRMHDLIRLDAAGQAGQDLTEAARDEALRRLADFYLHTAFAGQQLLDPHRPSARLRHRAAGCVAQPLEDRAAALDWFTAEHANLLAIQNTAEARNWPTLVWQLAWVLSTYLWRRGRLHDDLAVWRAGLAAATRIEDVTCLVRARQRLGNACARLGLHTEALEHLQEALALTERAGDHSEQAYTHRIFARAWEHQGDDARALEHARNALHLFRTAGNPFGQARALNDVGWHQARLGHGEQARTHCTAALAIARHHDYPEGEAAILDSLGYIAHHAGRHHQALHYYLQSLSVYRKLGHAYEEADTLEWLAHTHHALDQREPAHSAYQQALELYQTQNRAGDAERTRHHLTLLKR